MEKGRKGQDYFESMEMNNERSPMVSHQSIETPESVANDWKGVYEMKEDGMDEGYGCAGKRGVERDMAKAHGQFKDYSWA